MAEVSKPPRPPAPPASAASQFRRQIEAAESRGVARKDMTLHLTLSHVSELKRDRTIPLDDISFADGEMRFLGVKVTKAGAAQSSLDSGETPAGD